MLSLLPIFADAKAKKQAPKGACVMLFPEKSGVL